MKDKLNIPIVNLDLNKHTLYTKDKLKSQDVKSRFRRFKFYYNSKEFDLSNCTVRAYMIKPDSKEIFNDLTIIDNNIAELEFTNQALLIPGTLQLELVITQSESIISSFLLEFEIIKSLRNNTSIESTNEFTSLQLALQKIEHWNTNYQILYNTWNTEFKSKYDNLNQEYATDIVNLKNDRDSIWEKLKKLVDVQISISENGYLKFPTLFGGILLQWGRAYIEPSTYKGKRMIKVNYPVSFNNKCFSIQLNPCALGDENGYDLVKNIYIAQDESSNIPNNNFTVIFDYKGTNIGADIRWFAVGK